LKALQETDFWDPTFFHHASLGAVYHDFLRNILPEQLQNVHLLTAIHLRSMHNGDAPYFLLVLGILEQRVSVTTERTRWWTNSMDCSFP
jgi:hypothetical protein